MPTTSHTVTLSINGQDRTSLLLRDSLYVRHSMNNDASVAEFQMKDGGSAYTPVGWHKASVSVNGSVVFGGFIVQNDAVAVGVASRFQTNWAIQCKDWSVLLDRVVVDERYTEQADNAIISDLFGTYLAAESFTYSTYVANLANDIDISFERVTMRDALNQLADRCNASWFIAPDQSFHWNKYSSFSSAAFNIDTTSPNGSTTFSVGHNSMRRQVDTSNLVNRVSIIGGISSSGVRQTDTFTGDGSTDTFGPLTQPVNSMWSLVYTIGATAYSTYATNIGYEPQDRLAYEGGTFVALVNLENRTVRIRSSTGGVPDNATSVAVSYYYGTPVETTTEHTGSQNYYGRIFEQKVYDENLTSIASATEYAQRLLARYAFARETVQFDVYEHGLLPGTLIQVQCPEVGLYNTRTLESVTYENDLSVYYADSAQDIVLESGDSLVQEGYGSNSIYLIQEVSLQPTVNKQGQFMMVAKVTCGDRQHTVLDIIKRASGSTATSGPGRTPPRSNYGNLSSISGNLGEVVTGRALFTDGGTASFSWSNYAGHTGAVVGLEDRDGFTYGAAYILDAGTVKAKLGRMTGMPNIGTITPAGWGIYTTNGYFQGIVAAGTVDGSLVRGGTVTGSLISGGTVSGGLVTGGTVSGALLTGGTANISVGNIGGFVVAANQLYSNGGTISTGSIVNSSNPGVYLGTAGLFGFGTLGLTFALYTDPTRAPWFSSGTINNVVYEVYESAIMRTSPDVFSDGGVQIDSSGIFGVNPTTGAGALLDEAGNILTTEDDRSINFVGVNFMLDSTTGNIYAEQAWLAGTVFASAGVFTGTVYASDGSFTGTVYASDGSFAGTVYASDGSFTGTVTASTLTGNNISGGTVTGSLLSGNTVTGNNISGGTITGGRISGGTVVGALISGGTVTGALVTGGQVSAAGGTVTLDTNGLRLSASGGTAYDRAYIQWLQSGTILSGLSTYTFGNDFVWNENIGAQGTHNGSKATTTAGTVGNSSLAQRYDSLLYSVSGSEAFYVDANKFRIDGNLGDGWLTSGITYGTNIASDGTFVLKYRQFGDKVYLSGAVNCSSGTITAGVAIFTLPAGYRPASYSRIFAASQNGVPISVYITTGGELRSFTNYSAASGTLYLDGIFFFTT